MGKNVFIISQADGLQESCSASETRFPGFPWGWDIGGHRDWCQISACIDPKVRSRVAGQRPPLKAEWAGRAPGSADGRAEVALNDMPAFDCAEGSLTQQGFLSVGDTGGKRQSGDWPRRGVGKRGRAP